MTDTDVKPLEEKYKPIVKKYSASATEKIAVENLQGILRIMSIQYEAMRNYFDMEVFKIKERCGVNYNDVPKGYVRAVTFDPTKYELVVTDSPKIEEVKKDDTTDKKPVN